MLPDIISYYAIRALLRMTWHVYIPGCSYYYYWKEVFTPPFLENFYWKSFYQDDWFLNSLFPNTHYYCKGKRKWNLPLCFFSSNKIKWSPVTNWKQAAFAHEISPAGLFEDFTITAFQSQSYCPVHSPNPIEQTGPQFYNWYHPF